jgi:exosortase C (VPDSG-CTERM-specific)
MQPKAGVPTLNGRRAAVWAAWNDLSRPQRRRLGGFCAYLAVVILLFGPSLLRLAAHANQESLHSHVVLVPFITAYLLIINRRALPTTYTTSIAGALVMAAAGVSGLAAATALDGQLSLNDSLALTTFAWASFVAAGGFLFLGRRWMSAASFAMAFLFFTIPLPDAAAYWLERASVLASAEATSWLFHLTGALVIRQGTVFELPGIVLRVGQECSGIRSSWVLFITSVLASHLILEMRWRRALLVAFVFPLAIVRNAFRIFVIAMLCVHVGPYMIQSEFHRRGGPLFFGLSLIPLFLVVIWLRRGEQRPVPRRP